MFNPFPFIFGAGFTLIMLVPFGFAVMYVFMSFKQLMIAEKEKN